MLQDIGDQYPNGAINKEIIENFAATLEVTFPPEYVELISQHDGIYPEISSFDYVDIYGELNISTVELGGYLHEPRIEGMQFPEGDDDYEGKLISFGSTPGGNFICFDYRFPWIKDQPKIVLVLHDEFYDFGMNEGKRKVLYLADNFMHFINSLHEFIEY
ncbi:SMI1/KNR4 family protein [Acinetobacter pittii]|uniref:SMI1/KNR4 family protein n=1 Tax=Acinetobacter pittii TaxID=48296 RepID=UPI001980134F|nr:SMI1/KNR4 family protein [Acinetobacter pittii]MBN6494632.1 SMI1/KNR4 family protein [Acinetobacter pittii]